MTTTLQKCKWIGKSGKEYIYKIYKIGTDWYDVPGNYIFAKKTSANNWEAQYIGETESFKDRLPNHEKLPCAKQNGATHIHTHQESNRTSRLAEETDLRQNHTTPCNDQ